MSEEKSPETAKAERLQHMRELAQSLFTVEAPRPKKSQRELDADRRFFIVASIAFIIFAVAIFFRVNRFIDLEEKVTASDGKLEVAMQRRANLFKNIVNATLNQATLEYELVKHIADSRSPLKNAQKLKKVELDLESLEKLKSSPNIEVSLPQLTALVEQYPQIKFSSTYSQLIDNLMEIENIISERRNDRTEAIKAYNTDISIFPHYFLAKIAGFNRYKYFEIEEVSLKNAPVLNAEKYDRLLPAETHSQ
ncbi:LemA family protein [Deltaproteobacteria bacterium TL4]